MQSGNPNNQDDDPYGQPTIREFQYSPPYAPRQRRPGFRQWFWTRTRKTKFGLGCGAIVVILLLSFVCIIAASAASGIGTQVPTPTATTGLVAVQASPTVLQDTPTPVPTQQPTPTPTPTPLPKPTLAPTHAAQPTQPPPPPKPTPKPCQAVNGNPWCFNFVPGNLIDYPPSGFCNYFNCIASFYQSDDPGDGYIVECNDGTYSQSGGERGACSYHGGVMRPLYSH